MQIELLWFDGCPNHESARAVVEQVLASRGLDSAINCVDQGRCGDGCRREVPGIANDPRRRSRHRAGLSRSRHLRVELPRVCHVKRVTRAT
jgi:hypothetical protein